MTEPHARRTRNVQLGASSAPQVLRARAKMKEEGSSVFLGKPGVSGPQSLGIFSKEQCKTGTSRNPRAGGGLVGQYWLEKLHPPVSSTPSVQSRMPQQTPTESIVSSLAPLPWL